MRKTPLEHSSEDLKRIRDKGIISAELAVGASELVLGWLHELQQLYQDRFMLRYNREQNKEGRR